MRIYLMRHADAVEPGDWNGSDRTRPLTPGGLVRLRDAVGHMKRLRMSSDLLLTSPYVRAEQTAALISEELHVLQTLSCPELAAGARLDAFNELVRRHASESTLWFVCHMPEVAVFASRITGDPQAMEQSFRPAEVLAADCVIADGAIVSGRTLWRRLAEDWSTVSA